MTDQENRLYAVNLMNRADVAFDVRDIAVVGKLVEIVEADVADWLSSQLRGTVSREQIVAAVRAGAHRPDLPQPHPVSASMESNLK